MSSRKRKKAIEINVFGFITFLSLNIFYVVLFCLAKSNTSTIVTSYAVFTTFAFVAVILGKYKNNMLTKVVFISNTYFGIFFFDVFLGAATGMGNYYFPFLFVTVRIFSFQKEKALLFIFVFLPLLLFFVNGYYLNDMYNKDILSNTNIKYLRTFNYTFSFLLLVIYANYLLYNTLLNDKRLEKDTIALQTLIDNTSGSLWSISKDFQIITANKLYQNDLREIFGAEIKKGYDLKQIINSDAYPEGWKKQINTVLAGNNLIEEYNFNDKIFEIQGVPILDKDNEVVGAAFYNKDITSQKKDAEKIALTNKELAIALLAKEKFLSNMSHELRTPLNGIVGISNILQTEKDPSKTKEYLEILKYSSNHMMDIINDILDFYKIEAKKLELEASPYNLKEVASKTTNFFKQEAQRKNILLNLEMESIEGLIINGDELRMRQILTNLISNAIKFTHEGNVTVRIEKGAIKNNIVSIEFSVTDTGIGIDANNIALIFKSFSQADSRINKKYGGTGLGLTISDKLIALMGSKINVKSELGKGSCFYFTMEMEIDNTTVKGEDTEPIQLHNFNYKKALVVEDNKVNSKILCQFLENWKLDVIAVENGAIAVKLLQNEIFDLVLMDLEMPVMDGKKATLQIRDFNYAIPIIAITASVKDNLKQELLELGFNDYITKPFNPNILNNCIYQALQS